MRKAEWADLNSIFNIEDRVFDNPWTLEQIQTEFSRKTVVSITVIILQKTVIGYLMAHIVENDVQIVNVAIDIPYQHNGYGKIIMKYFLARYLDHSIITLEVKQSNYNAINLYLNLGFNEIGRRHQYYQNNEDAIIMAIGIN